MPDTPTPKDTAPRTPKDPLASVQDIAQRLVDDAEKLLTVSVDGAAKVAHEGIGVSVDVVQAGLDSIAIIRNKVGLAEQALRDALTKARA